MNEHVQAMYDRSLDMDGVTLYAKIASILRTQISSGSWKPGEQLPSIDILSQQHAVAKVTIRQAIRLLVKEGLLTSSRGRGTFVKPRDPQHGRATGPGYGLPQIEVRLLHRLPNEQLPGDLRLNHVALPSYEWIRKLHHTGSKMLFIMDSYHAPELTLEKDRLQNGRLMIISALEEELKKRRLTVETVVRVSSADAITARLLNCNLSFPIATIARTFSTRHGKIMLATKATYAADVFHMRTTQTMGDFLATRSASSVELPS